MQLGRLAVIAFSFQLLVLSFSLYALHSASAAWQESIYGPPWCDPANNIGCSLPINVSDNPQTKGTSALSTIFTVNGTLRSAWLEATEKLRIGAGAIADPDPIAALDVDGQIRIRGGVLPAPSNRILISDATGLGTWADAFSNKIFWLEAGFGIISSVSKPGYIDSNVDVNPVEIQRRITGTCPSNEDEAISAVASDGTVTCRPLVSSINTSTGGLTGGGTAGGPLSLGVNRGAGLGTGASLFVDPPWSGSGLVLSGNLKFDTFGCTGANVYWKYNGAINTWSCGAVLTHLPGESIMYLRSNYTTPTCPSSWVSLGVGSEFVSGWWNYVRICGRSVATDLCQTMYLTHSTNLSNNCNSPGTPAACPSGWIAAQLTTVYAPGAPNPNPYCNRARTCYKCN